MRVFPTLSYGRYNQAYKEEASHFGLQADNFTTHGGRVGATAKRFGQTRSLDAVTIEGGWKSKASAERYILNERAHIAALEIKPTQEADIAAAAQNFASRFYRVAKALTIEHGPPRASD